MVDYFKKALEVRVDARAEKLLGFSVPDDGDLVKFHNSPLMKQVLKAFKMDECKPTKTPLLRGLDLAMDASGDL